MAIHFPHHLAFAMGVHRMAKEEYLSHDDRSLHCQHNRMVVNLGFDF